VKRAATEEVIAGPLQLDPFACAIRSTDTSRFSRSTRSSEIRAIASLLRKSVKPKMIA
jgi:hypothetical protein